MVECFDESESEDIVGEYDPGFSCVVLYLEIPNRCLAPLAFVRLGDSPPTRDVPLTYSKVESYCVGVMLRVN